MNSLRFLLDSELITYLNTIFQDPKKPWGEMGREALIRSHFDILKEQWDQDVLKRQNQSGLSNLDCYFSSGLYERCTTE